MRVQNINGTSFNKCKCASWLQHWRIYSGLQIAYRCRAAGCSSPATVGAHVQKSNNPDFRWYIVPFCQAHNKAPESIELVAGTNLVSANVGLTCGR